MITDHRILMIIAQPHLILIDVSIGNLIIICTLRQVTVTLSGSISQ